MHYCMGKLADITYHVPQQSNHCDNCGMENSDCCHDNIQIVKLENVQNSVVAIDYKLPALKPVVQEYFNTSSALLYDGTVGSTAYDNSPPGINAKPLSILYCVFRI